MMATYFSMFVKKGKKRGKYRLIYLLNGVLFKRIFADY
jgi:hypothetical protein